MVITCICACVCGVLQGFIGTNSEFDSVIHPVGASTTSQFDGSELESNSCASNPTSMFRYVTAHASGWRKAQHAETQQYAEFLSHMTSVGMPVQSPSPVIPPSPIKPSLDDVDESLLRESAELFKKHLQKDRVPVKWITSVERAWNKTGRDLKSGRGSGDRNVRVGGFTPNSSGQVTADGSRSPTHHDDVRIIQQATDAVRPKTSHRKLRVPTVPLSRAVGSSPIASDVHARQPYQQQDGSSTARKPAPPRTHSRQSFRNSVTSGALRSPSARARQKTLTSDTMGLLRPSSPVDPRGLVYQGSRSVTPGPTAAHNRRDSGSITAASLLGFRA